MSKYKLVKKKVKLNNGIIELSPLDIVVDKSRNYLRPSSYNIWILTPVVEDKPDEDDIKYAWDIDPVTGKAIKVPITD